MLTTRLDQLNQAIKTNAGEAERSLAQLATTTTASIRASAHDAERSLTGISTGVSNVLKQNAGEVERTLLGVSTEVARNFVGKADEIATAVSQRSAEMTRILDEKSSVLLTALSPPRARSSPARSSRVTDHAVKAIEAKGFTFTQTMMDNSEHIARLINEATESGTGAIARSLKELQTSQSAATQSVERGRPPRRQGPARQRRTGDAGRLEDDRAHAARTAGDHAGRRRAVQADRLCRSLRDAGNPRHAALRHHRAVRAAARSQHPAAGSARAARTRT